MLHIKSDIPRFLVIAWALVACMLAADVASGDDLLRVEENLFPARVPAGATVPVGARFSVVEPIRDGWRVSAQLTPVPGGPSFKTGPVKSLFNLKTPVDTEKTVSFSILVPEDAAPGVYRVILEHYDKVDDKWVRIRYVNAAGEPQSTVLGELEIIPPLPKLPVPAAQRKLRPGEIDNVYECEDFLGMDGGGEDLATVRGWTWYSTRVYSRLRAAVNTTGSGTIYTQLEPPLPPGSYKLFVRAGTVFSTVRISLGEVSAEVAPLRVGWNEVGTLATAEPTSRLSIEAVKKLGQYIILDSLYVTNDLSTEATAGLDPSRQFLPADARPVKQRRTVWTEQYMSGVRRRMQEHESLQQAADETIAAGREIAAHSDRELWSLLADTSIKRTYYVNQNKGCPICGLKIKQHGTFHPWLFDPFERPFKMQCPSCKTSFPSNDFAAGEITGGEYPDDGTGCKIGQDTYHFIGEYVHWVYRTYYQRYLRPLTYATVLSEDPELAHKLGVMLLRAAQQWPNSEDRYLRSFNQLPGYHAGCFTDTIWSSGEGRSFGWAYDAVWPFLDNDDELLKLAQQEIPEIQTHEDLRLYIEENLLRRIGQQYCDTAIQGNAGYHHTGIAALLLALDDIDSQRFPNCRDLLEFLYYRVYGAMRYLPNLLGRDGCSFESTGYNASRLNMVECLATLQRFFTEQGDELPRDRYPSLWDDPRFAAQFDYYTDYMILDRWLPCVGDVTGGPIIPKREPPERFSVVSPQVAVPAWDKYRTPKLALLAYGLENKPPSPSLWAEAPLPELAAARAEAPQKLQRKTHIQDEYGLAFLRSGQGENARVLWAWYGQLLGHAQDDKLLYGLAGKGLDLLPDLGYPKSWEHGGRWESHCLTHNTIAVDGAAFPRGRQRGRVKLLGTISQAARRGLASPPLQVVQTESGDLSEQGQFATRLLALVDISDEDFYAVDLFDVRAGQTHTLSYHGPQATVSVAGVELTKQAGGTVAGEDIEYGQPQTDTIFRPSIRGRNKQTFTPLSHMTEVERGQPTAPFSLDYAIGDEQDTHVRLQHFPDTDTSLALGTGRPPSQRDAYHVRYCLQTRSGEVPLAGRYLTVVDPYTHQRTITQIQRLTPAGFGTGDALRIEYENGSDILLFGPTADITTQAGNVEFTGGAALVRYDNTGPALLCAYAFSALKVEDFSLVADSAYLTGEILSCDYDKWKVIISDVAADQRLVGQPLRIYNDLRSTLHIIAAVAEREGGTELTLTTTALRHEGWVSGVADRTIRDGAPSPWALDTFFTGTRLLNEAGDAQWMVSNAAGGWGSAPTGTRISLLSTEQAAASADALRHALTDSNGDGVTGFWIHEYGVGDRVEVSSFASLQRQDDGRWAGVLSPGARLVQHPNHAHTQDAHTVHVSLHAD